MTPLVVFLLVRVCLQAVLLRVDGHPDVVLWGLGDVQGGPHTGDATVPEDRLGVVHHPPLLHIQDLVDVVPEAGLGATEELLEDLIMWRYSIRTGSLEQGQLGEGPLQPLPCPCPSSWFSSTRSATPSRTSIY